MCIAAGSRQGNRSSTGRAGGVGGRAGALQGALGRHPATRRRHRQRPAAGVVALCGFPQALCCQPSEQDEQRRAKPALNHLARPSRRSHAVQAAFAYTRFWSTGSRIFPSSAHTNMSGSRPLRLQMGADLERVQRERDAALARLSQQSSSGETLEQELEAGRKQLRRVEVGCRPRSCVDSDLLCCCDLVEPTAYLCGKL